MGPLLFCCPIQRPVTNNSERSCSSQERSSCSELWASYVLERDCRWAALKSTSGVYVHRGEQVVVLSAHEHFCCIANWRGGAQGWGEQARQLGHSSGL